MFIQKFYANLVHIFCVCDATMLFRMRFDFKNVHHVSHLSNFALDLNQFWEIGL